MILPIAISKIEMRYRWRVNIVVSSKVLRGRISESWEAKGVMMMVRMSKLVHIDTIVLWAIECQDRAGVEDRGGGQCGGIALCGRLELTRRSCRCWRATDATMKREQRN